MTPAPGKTSTYLDQPADELGRQAVPQHRFDENPQHQHVHPRHGRLAEPRPSQPHRLTPQLALLTLQPLDLPLLLLPAALLEAEVPRRPPLLAALVHKLGRVLLERGDGVEGELGVGGEGDGGAGNDHGAEGFVGFEVVFLEGVGYREEVRLEVFGRGDQVGGVDDGGEGAGG